MTDQSQAFNAFNHSAGMNFVRGAGNTSNALYAGRGSIDSPAAMTALRGYGENTARQAYFPAYTGLLQGQQAVGAGAASAVAGVGSSFGQTAAGINGQMGQAINSGAQNIGNLQLANGQNQANMWGGIGNALGGFASSFGGVPSFNSGSQLPVNINQGSLFQSSGLPAMPGYSF